MLGGFVAYLIVFVDGLVGLCGRGVLHSSVCMYAGTPCLATSPIDVNTLTLPQYEVGEVAVLRSRPMQQRVVIPRVGARWPGHV